MHPSPDAAILCLMPATIHPKTVGGMCYAIIKLTPIVLKQPLVTSQSQVRRLDMLSYHAMCSQAAPACNCQITGLKSQTCYPSMHRTDKLSQHALQNSRLADSVK